MTDGLDLVTIFFKKAADVWYDENKAMQTGASLFNNMADGLGVPVCRMFSGGAQEASDGIVKMFAIDPSYSTSNYGINSTYDYRGALLIELMLPGRRLRSRCLERTQKLCADPAVLHRAGLYRPRTLYFPIFDRIHID